MPADATDEPVLLASESEPRWRLSGVVQRGDARVLVLNDGSTDSTVRLNVDSEYDGWTVADSGTDFAVLQQGTREVRLDLNDDSGD